MPKAWARWATSRPMLPRPTTPRTLSRSSLPRKRDRSQRPALTAWSACGICRASASIMAIVCSAAAMVLPEGALTTRTPARVAAATSMLSTPAPARPMTLRRVPAWITAASTRVSLRTSRASYPAMRAISAAGLSFSSTSTSAWPRNRARPASAIGSATRTRGTGSGDEAGLGRLQRTLRRGQRRAAGHRVPIGLETPLQHLDGRDDVVLVHGAEMTDAEDLARQFSLSLTDDETLVTPGPKHRLGFLAAQRFRKIERGHGGRGGLRVGGEQAKPKRTPGCPECGGDAQMPLENAGQPLFAHHRQRLAQPKEDAYRGRGERHALGLQLLRTLPVKVETRSASVRLALPRGLTNAQHGHAGREHPSLLRRRDRNIHAPAIDRQLYLPHRADPIDHQQPLTALDDLGQRLQPVGHSRRGLVVRDQDCCDIRLFAQEVIEVLGIGGLAPRWRVADPLVAKGLRKIGKAVAEGTDGNREHPLTRRDEIGDRAFEAAGPARRKDQHVVLSLEGPLEARLELREKRLEFRTAVVDHRGVHRALNATRNGRRTRNTEL